ncbi:MAG: ubiquinone biosynthesis protein UbiE [Peptococcaceae bacterium BRH_c4b]|nr:MAG: ubiquinone biosynthesis protein UbiE [Peptococcaceae bacterium BRH_c4b]
MQDHLSWFNEKASIWDTVATEETRRRLHEVILSLGIAVNSTVLDVATGTGLLIPWLREAAGPGGRLVAIDFSPEMIVRARAKFPDGVEFLVADVHSIDFQDNTFDEVICNSAFPHFANKTQAMAEMARVLKKGGRLTICHPATREELNEFHSKLGGTVGGDMLPPDYEMSAMAEAAGLIGTAIVDGPEYYVLTAWKGKRQ